MLKSLIIIIITFFIVDTAFCSVADTSVTYYKNDVSGYPNKVGSLDSADFFRIIYPPDAGEVLYNIQEFYKNGKIKLAGKSDQYLTKLPEGKALLQGSCITYYPDGKRRSIDNYYDGYPDGMSTMYYPNGKLYCTIKYTYGGKTQYMDCYDTTGNKTATGGNGHWLFYNPDHTVFFMEGNVKDGFCEGEWKGRITSPELIRFTYVFNKSKIVSAIGHDPNGTQYSFKYAGEPAKYKDGALVFSGILKRHFVAPKDSNGKIIKDAVNISFVIEKDGHLDGFAVEGKPDAALAQAAITALKQCPNWQPRKMFGVPVKSRITFPVNAETYLGIGRRGNTMHGIGYNEEIIDYDPAAHL